TTTPPLFTSHRHPSSSPLFLLILPPPPTPTLFPYTTLFRSHAQLRAGARRARHDRQTSRDRKSAARGIAAPVGARRGTGRSLPVLARRSQRAPRQGPRGNRRRQRVNAVTAAVRSVRPVVSAAQPLSGRRSHFS